MPTNMRIATKCRHAARSKSLRAYIGFHETRSALGVTSDTRHEPWEVVHSIVLMPALDRTRHVVYEDPLFRFSPVIVNVNSADPAVAVVGEIPVIECRSGWAPEPRAPPRLSPRAPTVKNATARRSQRARRPG